LITWSACFDSWASFWMQFGWRIGRRGAGFFGLPDGLLDMAHPLLDFGCLQHDATSSK
jgi:hypothetical protein